MLTMEQAAAAVGVSPRQLRRRVEATRPLLAPFIRRGEKNRVLFDQGAVEILRAVEDRRASGATLEDARAWVAVSVRGEQGSEQGRGRERTGDPETPRSGAPSSSELSIMQDVIEDLRRDRDAWRNLALRLQDQVLALPAPRRGLRSLFRRRG